MYQNRFPIVLETYVDLANNWIKKFKLGESTAECYPFEIEKTQKMAALFKKKVNFISQIPYGAVGGAVIGGSVWAGEKSYNGVSWFFNEMSRGIGNFERALKNGWNPGR